MVFTWPSSPCREYNLDYRVNDVTVHTEDISWNAERLPGDQ